MAQMIKGLLSLSTQFKLKVNSTIDHHTLCVACLAPGATSGLCPQCLAQLPRNRWACRRCALPLPGTAQPEALCGQCQTQPPPFWLTEAPWLYHFPVDQLIGRYKYQRQLSLGHPLIHAFVDHMAQVLETHPERRPELMVPSPMHPKRQRQRGFNQAEDIAEQLGCRLNIPWSITLIERSRSARRQSGLNRQQRQDNLRGIFQARGRAPRRVAIIDDVMTTGATARALAQALASAGAQEIQVWALARTP
ncbi:ComF family protein [Marinobacter sp. SS21]|uniref:ComF family protein n=1 Tax=Marinobacter sp. SS21 TaxID=2979460 RepID=UPI00232BCCCD|nr:ComF family protein [Marinobacter sp. SS21]MDC0661703.1 ComF family protein [Marinobacter sp. SS21]